MDCPFCRRNFRDPRLLPCLHSVCRACIERLSARADNKPEINCPVKSCGASCRLPDGGAAELPRDTTSPSTDSGKCDICQQAATVNGAKDPAVAVICQTCQVNLCKDHFWKHMEAQGIRHDILTVPSSFPKGTAEARELSSCNKAGSRLCPDHAQPLMYYCSQCDVSVCGGCTAVGKHTNHLPIILRTQVAQITKENADAQIQKLSYDVKPRLEEALHAVDHVTTQLTINADQVRDNIRSATQRAVHTFHACGEQLLQKVDDIETARHKVLEEQRDSLNTHLNAVNTALQFNTRLQQYENLQDQIELLEALKCHATSLAETPVEMQPCCTGSVQLTPPAEEFLLAKVEEALIKKMSRQNSASYSSTEHLPKISVDGGRFVSGKPSSPTEEVADPLAKVITAEDKNDSTKKCLAFCSAVLNSSFSGFGDSSTGVLLDSSTPVPSVPRTSIAATSTERAKCVAANQLKTQRLNVRSRAHTTITTTITTASFTGRGLTFAPSVPCTVTTAISDNHQHRPAGLSEKSNTLRLSQMSIKKEPPAGDYPSDCSHLGDSHYDYCADCSDGGKLLKCDSCPLVYHLDCLDPPLTREPEGDWNCPVCNCDGQKKFHLEEALFIHLPLSWKIDKIAQHLEITTVKKCYVLLRCLRDHVNSYPFRKPVTEREAPDYHEVIKEPMDLSTVEERLRNGYYKAVKNFTSDLFLIFDNCDNYNKPYTEIAGLGRHMRQYLCKQLQEMQLGFLSQPLDFSPAVSPAVTYVQKTDNAEPLLSSSRQALPESRLRQSSVSGQVSSIISISPLIKKEPIDDSTVQLQRVDTVGVRTGFGTTENTCHEEGSTNGVFLSQLGADISDHDSGSLPKSPLAKRSRRYSSSSSSSSPSSPSSSSSSSVSSSSLPPLSPSSSSSFFFFLIVIFGSLVVL